MKSALFVTGGNGYVGRVFLRSGHCAGYRKIVCVRRGETEASPESSCDWVKADLRDPALYRAALAGCDAVVHMAAATGKKPPRTYLQENVEATQALMEAARSAGVSRFLHISTIAVTIPDTSDYPYATSKRQAEEIIRASGLKYTILRPTIIVGPGAPVLDGLMKLAAAPVTPLFGGGTALVQPIDVGDLTEIMHAILRGDWFQNQTVDVGGPEVVSMKEFLTRIRLATGRKPAFSVPVPLGPIAPLLRMMERVMLPAMPITAGQLKSFASDGVAADHSYLADWRGRLKGIDAMLRTAVRHAG